MAEIHTVTTPVAPPILLGYSSPTGGSDRLFWSDGSFLMIPDGATLPPRCFKRNSAEEVKMSRKTLAWVPPWMYLLIIFPGLLIGGIIILATQRKARIGVRVCGTCRGRFLKHTLIILGIFLAAVVSFVMAVAFENGAFALAGVVLLLTLLAYAVVRPRAYQTIRIENATAKLKGASPYYLASLDQP